MARADFRVIGPQGTLPRYLVSGGTSILYGEPLDSEARDLTSGATAANTWLIQANDGPIVGTDLFGGIAIENSLNNNAATPVVLEQYLNSANPVPNVGLLRANAETPASVDTLTELALLIGDVILIDRDATGATDGGELYTLKEAATTDTHGLEIVDGNTSISTLDVTVHPNCYRFDFA